MNRESQFAIISLLAAFLGCGDNMERAAETVTNAPQRENTEVVLDESDLDKIRESADQGDAEAQHGLGIKYHNGIGVPQNDAEAVKWFRLAADQGVAEAQFMLGGLYMSGKGVAKDNTEAAKWFRLAAEQGDAMAQYSLGLEYYKGTGIPKDDAEAYMWLTVAAESGMPTKMFLDKIDQNLTQQDLSKAQQRATELLEKIESGKEQ